MIVQENGIFYNIDEDSGLVTEASIESLDPELIQSFDEDIHIGNRVEVKGELGQVISIVSSVYGPAFGIRFDVGSIDEFSEDQLKKSTVEKIDFDTPLSEIFARFAAYESLPMYTENEVAVKESEARVLNLRAKSLITDKKLSFSDQTKLDEIVLVTGVDLLDIKEAKINLQVNQDYLNSFNKYKIADTVHSMGGGLGLHGDASWLHSGVDGMEVVETTETDLAARAVEIVGRFTEAQLTDDEFMKEAMSYQHEYLQNNPADAEKFVSYVETAREDKLKELKTNKVASIEDDQSDINDFDSSALYL